MNRTSLFTIISFCGLLLVLSIGSVWRADVYFSENENRILSQKPAVSFASILDGTFQEGLESYLQDQVVFRDGWNAFHSAMLLAAGNVDIGGAYVGSDGYDFEKIVEKDVDSDRIRANTEAVKRFMDRQTASLGRGHVSFLLVPTSGLVLADKVPDGAPLFDQDTVMDEVLGELAAYDPVDLREVFAERRLAGEAGWSDASELAGESGRSDWSETSGESGQVDAALYYHTDHHWTSHGAYLAYAAWNESAPAEGDFRISRVTDHFRGSLYSKILNPNSVWDSIERYDLTEAEIPGLYDAEKLNEKDKYAYFLGGNEGVVSLENPAARDDESVVKKGGDVGKSPDDDSISSGRRLLIIKDSFANAFVPFAITEYAQVDLIDLRYYTEKVDEFIAENDTTDVLILYNVSNFISDRNVGKLGR